MEFLFTKCFLQNKNLYISDIGDWDRSLIRDIMDDLLLVPIRNIMDDLLLIFIRNIHHSKKYKYIIEELEKLPEIIRLVGHSLVSAVIRLIKNNLIYLL